MDREVRMRNLECPVGMVDLVIDTDAFNEVDDQFAIAYAIHAREKLRVQALYAAPFFNERSTGPADGMEKEIFIPTVDGEEKIQIRVSRTGDKVTVEKPEGYDLTAEIISEEELTLA